MQNWISLSFLRYFSLGNNKQIREIRTHACSVRDTEFLHIYIWKHKIYQTKKADMKIQERLFSHQTSFFIYLLQKKNPCYLTEV